LLLVLRVAPARPVPFEERGAAIPEGAALCDGKALCLPLGFLRVERIYPIKALLPVICRPSACIRKRAVNDRSALAHAEEGGLMVAATNAVSPALAVGPYGSA
jgi:hypothetical protein